MVKEDDLVSYLIEFDQPSDIDERDFDECEYTAHPEQHYDHYGNRGSVDLFTRFEGHDDGRITLRDAIYEVKADTAIEQSTGANEIIRQYNKHREYFYTGTDFRDPDRARFELVFIPTPTTIQHLIENASIYAAVNDTQIHERDYWREGITLREPGCPRPVHPIVKQDSLNDLRNPRDMINDGFPNQDSQCGETVKRILEQVLN